MNNYQDTEEEELTERQSVDMRRLRAVARWLRALGRKLYPGWEWSIRDGTDTLPSCWTADRLFLRARHIDRQTLAKHGIIMKIPLESVFWLKDFTEEQRAELAKQNLMVMIEQAQRIEIGWAYPVCVFRGREKTLAECVRDSSEAWRDFLLGVAYAWKVDKVCDFLVRCIHSAGKWVEGLRRRDE